MGNFSHITPAIDHRGNAEVTAVFRNYPEWAVQVAVEVGDFGAVTTSLAVFPCRIVDADGEGTWAIERARKAPGAGVPARALREINLGQLVEEARRHAQAVPDDSDMRDIFPEVALTRSRKVAGATKRRPGRTGHGPEHYAIWAARYAAKIAGGDRRPIATLADEWPDETLGNRQYVRDTINDARTRYGFLTSAGQGRPGGRLTKQALAVLESIEGGNDGER